MKKLAQTIAIAITIITIVTEICGTVALSFLKDTDKIYSYWGLLILPLLVITTLFCVTFKSLHRLKKRLIAKIARETAESTAKIERETAESAAKIEREAAESTAKIGKRVNHDEDELEVISNKITEVQKEISDKFTEMQKEIFNKIIETLTEVIKRIKRM